MKVTEIRKAFIKFFEEKKHKIVPSSNLMPIGDPTLLFTAAGMVQFKKLWSGEMKLPYRKAVSCQKCLRASDLESVGKSPQYMTFFEMLGNFSFGDYFKAEAIEWAWEFLTEVIKLPKDKLYVTVFDEDEDAYKIWQTHIEKGRIYKLDKEDNFWTPVGGRGACGPCSEIFYDRGEEFGVQGEKGSKVQEFNSSRVQRLKDSKVQKFKGSNGQEFKGSRVQEFKSSGNRFMEIWNLVFPQYDSQADGALNPLKNRGIDTGMGLERFSMAVQGKKSVFELDIFQPIIDEAKNICKIKEEIPLNIITDHIRALTFAIAEGIYPSNVGRGYLLRRLLRRAQLSAYEFGVKKPFLYKLVDVVCDVMRDQYPELIERKRGVAVVVKSEEESFLKTLEQGARVFNQVLSGAKKKEIPGEDVFKLYDTYGFPVELTAELAEHKGFKVDKAKFDKLLESQRERARSTGKFEEIKTTWTEIKGKQGQLPLPTHTEFVGYEDLKTKAKIVKWREINPKLHPVLMALSLDFIDMPSIELVLDKTPFYPESGGQVGDRGRIFNKDLEFEVLDTQNIGGLWIHIGKLKSGKINDREVICEVDKERRKAIECNHTGTHLLHSALRKVLGARVHQEGSLVKAERFRFDFTQFKPLDENEIKKVEELIQTWLYESLPVETYETSYEKAVRDGAMAIFGEKYGKDVRVVKIGDISMELCGGTHIKNTSEIGVLKILSETGIHAGIRRIEAITGTYALERLKKCEQDLVSVSNMVGTELFKTKDKIYELLESEKKLRNRMNQLEQKGVLKLAPEILSKKKVVNGIDVLTAKVSTKGIENLRVLADKLRTGKKRVGVLGAAINENPVFITFVSDDLKGIIKAGKLAQELGKLAGGGGGGKDTIGQAGGNDPKKIDSILKNIPNIIKKIAIQN